MGNRLVGGLVASLIGLVTSFAMAVGLISLGFGFGRVDFAAFSIWNGLFLGGLFILTILVSEWLALRRKGAGVLLALLFGVLYSYLYTLVLVLMFGPWFLLWGFNAFDCWVVAASLGLLGSTLFNRARNRGYV